MSNLADIVKKFDEVAASLQEARQLVEDTENIFDRTDARKIIDNVNDKVVGAQERLQMLARARDGNDAGMDKWRKVLANIGRDANSAGFAEAADASTHHAR